MPDSENATETITELLTSSYGLVPDQLTQLPIGQGTVNYRAACGDRDVFVKSYQAGTDLTAEREAITLSELAGRSGVPVAGVLPDRSGEVIAAAGPVALSVWEWMPGTVITDGLTPGQLEQAGGALGRIHAAFARLPASSGPAPQVDEWRDIDIAGLEATISKLQSIICDRFAAGESDEFDAAAKESLTERQAMISRVPGLLAALPQLTAQVLHGDYSPVNLLFERDTLSAVIDFRPPDPFLIAYDLGRMAFYPNTVVGDAGWLDSARTLITAYLDTNPGIAADDILWCARVALIQLLGSLYGVKQHYLKPGLFQDRLDDFWFLRHRAAGTLLGHLSETDDLLNELSARTSRRS